MGIKDFTKVFEPQEEIKFKDLKGKWVAVDALYEIHRGSRPFRTKTGSTNLMGKDGRVTNHINTLLFGLIFKLQEAGVYQCWVFDHPLDGHNPLKQIEVERRKVCQQKATEKLEACKKRELTKKQQVISDSDNSDDETLQNKSSDAEIKLEIAKYERGAFTLESYFIEDLKFILDCLDVPWIEAPLGFEAEQLAAQLTRVEIDEIRASAVITPDPDTLLFGAKTMIKRSKGKLYKYVLKDLLEENELDQNSLITIGVILGCDFAKKTKGVGAKTVLKKYEDVELTDCQEKAVGYFKKKIPKSELENLEWNQDGDPFEDKKKIKILFDWVVNIKGFSKLSTEKKFAKLKLL